jgi:large subunit ribosomal protein L32
MAVPKRRTSRSRRDKRRSHHALGRPPQATCPECGAPRTPHRVCGSCGQYRGRTVIETKEEF